MKLGICAALVVAMLILFPGTGFPDTVIMSNGDQLTGEVVTMAEGRLALDTEYAGVVHIDWGRAARLWLDEPLPAVLADGRGEWVDALPTPEIALADVVALAPAPPPAPAGVRWKGRVDFGWARTEGNRNTDLGTLTAFAERERPERYRLSLLLDAARGSSEGEETANRARAEGKFDRRTGERAYRYLLAGAGYDRVRDIELRVEVGAGVGRTLVEKPGHLLSAEIGASFVRDAFESGESESDLKLRLGETWQRKVWTGTELRQTLSLLSAADELGDYTAEFVLALSHRLTDRVSLVSKLVNSYDSRPAPGTKRNDFTVATQLGVAFGD